MGEELRVHADHQAARRAARPTPIIKAVRKSRAASARLVMFFILFPLGAEAPIKFRYCCEVLFLCLKQIACLLNTYRTGVAFLLF